MQPNWRMTPSVWNALGLTSEPCAKTLATRYHQMTTTIDRRDLCAPKKSTIQNCIQNRSCHPKPHSKLFLLHYCIHNRSSHPKPHSELFASSIAR